MSKSGFYIGALVVIAGLVMLISPQKSIEIVIIVLGAGSVLTGLFDIVTTRTMSDDSAFRKTALIRGLASIIIGLLAICLPLAFFQVAENIVRVMLYILAVFLIISAISEFLMVSKLPENSPLKKSFIMEALGFIALSVILFLIPANFGELIVRIMGLLLMIGGAAFSYSDWKNNIRPTVKVESIRDDEDDVQEETDSEAKETTEENQ